MISIIIPTLNEAENISQVIGHLHNNLYKKHSIEIIVADGNSDDGTVLTAKQLGAKVIVASRPGRAIQMNAGAEIAGGETLYFLHADSLPPVQYDKFMEDVLQNGYKSGCFRMRWNKQGPFLTFLSWMTRFNANCCRGGDQSLFVLSETFRRIHGFREDFNILEDMEIIPRLKKEGAFYVVPKYLTTSDRRYRKNGTIRLQALFTIIHLLYNIGVSQKILYRFYKKHIR
jgi:rSAM/selenodomain-associated transferase 2